MENSTASTGVRHKYFILKEGEQGYIALRPQTVEISINRYIYRKNAYKLYIYPNTSPQYTQAYTALKREFCMDNSTET
jgi:hypothetical protein